MESLQTSLGAQTAAVMKQQSSLEEARSYVQDTEERMKMTVGRRGVEGGEGGARCVKGGL